MEKPLTRDQQIAANGVALRRQLDSAGTPLLDHRSVRRIPAPPPFGEREAFQKWLNDTREPDRSGK